MKKIILAFLLIPFSNQIFAQTDLLSVDFQSGIPSNFTLVDNDGNTPNSAVSEFINPWITYEDPDSLINKVAASTSFFTAEDSADRWLITPPLQLGAFGNFLNWKAKSHDPSFPDDYFVLLSTTGTNLSDFIDTLGAIEQENFEWTSREVNLSTQGYNNQQVYIAFVIRTFDGFKLYLDDLKVRKEDPVSVVENDLLTVNLFPNPFQTDLVIQTDEAIDFIRVFDTKGSLLLESKSTILDLAHLEKGNYFVQISSGSKSVTRKVIKF